MSRVNAPIEDDANPSIQKAEVTIAGIGYEIQRYKKGNIRVFREGSSHPEKNSKAFLRIVDEEYGLSLDKEDWKQTQKAGKAILDKLSIVNKG